MGGEEWIWVEGLKRIKVGGEEWIWVDRNPKENKGGGRGVDMGGQD